MTAAATLAHALRAARRSHGLTQSQLAELAGVSERTLRDLEHGSGSPSLAALLAVTEVLGLRVEVR
jgi:y4mF family transcriptional regulator